MKTTIKLLGFAFALTILSMLDTNAQGRRDRREDMRDRREDVRDKKENRKDKTEDRRDLGGYIVGE